MRMVTAVITTHKREKEIIERAINSILAQTYSPIELIVVDDSPADFPQREQVRQLAQEKGAIYIAHETCRGACAARNTGLAAASGEFIAFLDDDDAWLPEKIQKQLEKFSDGVALVYCGNDVYNCTTGQTTRRKTKFMRGSVYPELIKENFIGSTSFPLLRKACLEEVGGFDVLMQSAQDYDVWLRLAEKYSVDYVEEALVLYYVHDGECITKNSSKRIAGQERINQKNSAYLKKHRHAYWIRTIKLTLQYASNGQLGKALVTWLKAVVKAPEKVRKNMWYLYWSFRRWWDNRR